EEGKRKGEEGRREKGREGERRGKRGRKKRRGEEEGKEKGRRRGRGKDAKQISGDTTAPFATHVSVTVPVPFGHWADEGLVSAISRSEA
ncbi:hypothetical protein, partial [Rhizobium johnstonii]|uniref:hypothetical protein n=1 Tax=Rhizobium johnstonii TaxID=3019933 RepID=UPI003F988B41